MIKITVELIPFGIGSKASKTWTAHIWNNLTGNKSIGNYYFKIFKQDSTEEVWKGGEVNNFKRKQWSVWYLIYLCLRNIYGD